MSEKAETDHCWAVRWRLAEKSSVLQDFFQVLSGVGAVVNLKVEDCFAAIAEDLEAARAHLGSADQSRPREARGLLAHTDEFDPQQRHVLKV
jgi:hypothetical protein